MPLPVSDEPRLVGAARDPDLRRVAVVGVSGVGKSTAARRLGRILRVDLIQVDRLRRQVGANDDRLLARIAELTLRARWVFDGTGWIWVGGKRGAPIGPVFDGATAILWLNYSSAVIWWRYVKRLREWLGPKRSGPWRESLAVKRMLRRIVRIDQLSVRRRRYGVFFEGLDNAAAILEFRHPRELEAFLRRLESRRPPAARESADGLEGPGVGG